MKKITLLSLLISLSITVAAQNDICTNATVITAGSYSASAIVSNLGGIPSPICAFNGPGATGGKWYAFTATVDGVANINTDVLGTVSADTRVHIYTGTCGSLVCAGGNDDIDGGNYLSNATWVVSSGVSYYIAFDDRWDNSAFNFDLTETPVTCQSTYPIMEDFDSGNQFVFCYTVEDTDGDGNAWIQETLDLDITPPDETFATASTSGTIQNNWLFSPPLTLVSGADYDFSFKFNGADAANPANESLEVLLIDAASSSGNVLTTLYSDTGIVQTGAFADLETNATAPNINYTSTASGTYYLAFHIFSPANSGFLLLFDYSVDQTLGIGDLETNSFKHFYNENTDILTLKSATSSFSGIELFNILGQSVLNKILSRTEESLNLSSLNNGVYIGKVRIEDKFETFKILKQ